MSCLICGPSFTATMFNVDSLTSEFALPNDDTFVVFREPRGMLNKNPIA